MSTKKYFSSFFRNLFGAQNPAKNKQKEERYLHISKRFRQLTDAERVIKDKHGTPTGVILPEFFGYPGDTYNVGRNKKKAITRANTAVIRMIEVMRSNGKRTPKIKNRLKVAA